MRTKRTTKQIPDTWGDPEPEETYELSFEGNKLLAYSYGQRREKEHKTIFCVNGGPGAPSDYVRAPLATLAEFGYRVVIHDQLETGRSSRPGDKSKWTFDYFVEELEFVRRELSLGQVHYFGHSWGGWLGIEYAMRYQENLASLVLSNTCADIPHLREQLKLVRARSLGKEALELMSACEAKGDFEHKGYQAAVALLDSLHRMRLGYLPEPIKRTRDMYNRAIYEHVQGPNEYHYIGTIKDWNRMPDLPKIKVPSLVLGGAHDMMTPACAERMQQALPNSILHVFPNGSHTPFYDEFSAYINVLLGFLDKQTETGEA